MGRLGGLMPSRAFIIYQRRGDTAHALCEVRSWQAQAALADYCKSQGMSWEDQLKARLYAAPKPKVSPEMAHVLNLAREQGANISWVPLVNGKGSQSRTVGRSMTISACRRHGWLNDAGELTEAGRKLIYAYNERNGIA